jgi:hypothetical protein
MATPSFIPASSSSSASIVAMDGGKHGSHSNILSALNHANNPMLTTTLTSEGKPWKKKNKVPAKVTSFVAAYNTRRDVAEKPNDSKKKLTFAASREQPPHAHVEAFASSSRTNSSNTLFAPAAEAGDANVVKLKSALKKPASTSRTNSTQSLLNNNTTSPPTTSNLNQNLPSSSSKQPSQPQNLHQSNNLVSIQLNLQSTKQAVEEAIQIANDLLASNGLEPTPYSNLAEMEAQKAIDESRELLSGTNDSVVMGRDIEMGLENLRREMRSSLRTIEDSEREKEMERKKLERDQMRQRKLEEAMRVQMEEEEKRRRRRLVRVSGKAAREMAIEKGGTGMVGVGFLTGRKDFRPVPGLEEEFGVLVTNEKRNGGLNLKMGKVKGGVGSMDAAEEEVRRPPRTLEPIVPSRVRFSEDVVNIERENHQAESGSFHQQADSQPPYVSDSIESTSIPNVSGFNIDDFPPDFRSSFGLESTSNDKKETTDIQQHEDLYHDSHLAPEAQEAFERHLASIYDRVPTPAPQSSSSTNNNNNNALNTSKPSSAHTYLNSASNSKPSSARRSSMVVVVNSSRLSSSSGARNNSRPPSKAPRVPAEVEAIWKHQELERQIMEQERERERERTKELERRREDEFKKREAVLKNGDMEEKRKPKLMVGKPQVDYMDFSMDFISKMTTSDDVVGSEHSYSVKSPVKNEEVTFSSSLAATTASAPIMTSNIPTVTIKSASTTNNNIISTNPPKPNKHSKISNKASNSNITPSYAVSAPPSLSKPPIPNPKPTTDSSPLQTETSTQKPKKWDPATFLQLQKNFETFIQSHNQTHQPHQPRQPPSQFFSDSNLDFPPKPASMSHNIHPSGLGMVRVLDPRNRRLNLDNIIQHDFSEVFSIDERTLEQARNKKSKLKGGKNHKGGVVNHLKGGGIGLGGSLDVPTLSDDAERGPNPSVELPKRKIVSSLATVLGLEQQVERNGGVGSGGGAVVPGSSVADLAILASGVPTKVNLTQHFVSKAGGSRDRDQKVVGGHGKIGKEVKKGNSGEKGGGGGLSASEEFLKTLFLDDRDD